MVEISLARYEALLVAERNAAILKSFINYKIDRFQEISRAEIDMLKELFCSDNTEREA